MSEGTAGPDRLGWENEALRRQVAALGAEVGRLKTTLQSAGNAAKLPDENPSPVQRFAADGTLLYANASSAALLDLWGCRIGSRPPDEVRRTIAEAHATGATREVEASVGGIFYSLTIVPIRSANYVNAYGTDITARKQAADALRKSEAQLRSVLNATPFPIALVDVQDNHIEFWSDSALTLFGHTAPTALEWYQIAYPDPDYRREVIERWKPVLERARVSGQTVNTGEYRVTCRDGSVRLCELYATFLPDRLIVTFNDITERKRVEEALRESEARFRDTFEHSAIGRSLTGPDGRLLKVNQALADMLGFSIKELQQVTFVDITHPDDVAESRECVRCLFAGERAAYRIEKRYRHRDGHFLFADVSTTLLRDAQGAPRCLITSVVDISERKRIAHDLEASETRYRRLFEAAKDGILILDADTGRIVDVNPFMEELTGYSRDAFLGQYLWEIGPFKDIAASKAAFAELQAREYVRYEDLPLQTRDGRNVNVEFVSNVYPVDGQKVVQCNIRDITARKRAEDELRFRNLILSTQQEASVDGILVVDVDGKIVSSNRRFADMWGISPDIIESRADGRALQAAMERLVDPEGFIRKVKYLYANRDERSQDEVALKDGRTFDRYSAPMIGADGKHFGRVWHFRDITARKQAEAEREKLEERLRLSQRLEAVGSLAGGVAHDFNNLLSVILCCTEFAMAKVREEDHVRNELWEVKKAGERAVSLTRQLLAFSRKQVLQPVVLNLNQIAAGVEKMLRRILGEDIDYVQVLAPDLGRVRADPGQIEQVLMNLVVNARDAMPEGGKLTIETSNVDLDEEYAARHVAVKPGPYVQLAVSDTGCGMDAKTQARIFEPFFTTKEKGKGTGLGLSTVYGIVKQSGGNIWVYSEPGQGTTFKIYLPRELSGSTTVTASRLAAVVTPPTATETILVVEDEEAVCNIAKRILSGAGYTVLTAASPNDALLICNAHQGEVHLLLTDVVMPQMSGRVLAERLVLARPGMKVLYMSGYTDDAIVHQGTLDPGTHFIAKPFSAADLKGKVREMLDSAIADPADGHEQAAKADTEMKERLPDREAFRALPSDVLNRLRQAAIAARYDEIIELIETLRITAPNTAAQLRRMADVFDYDGIRETLGQ
jgi:PAS domain S-box-containing protein